MTAAEKVATVSDSDLTRWVREHERRRSYVLGALTILASLVFYPYSFLIEKILRMRERRRGKHD